jgi:hypothetical protein
VGVATGVGWERQRGRIKPGAQVLPAGFLRIAGLPGRLPSLLQPNVAGVRGKAASES